MLQFARQQKKIVEGKYPHILAFMCSSDSKFGIEHWKVKEGLSN